MTLGPTHTSTKRPLPPRERWARSGGPVRGNAAFTAARNEEP
jgi:hypothetical protein